MMPPVGRRLILAAIAGAAILPAAPACGQEGLGETGTKGAGSTFVHPLLSRWSREYRAWVARGGDYPGLEASLDDPSPSSTLEYEPVGSLAGVLRLKDRAVDFAASDMPLKRDELAGLGLGQFPIVVGGVVVAVNADGVPSGRLKLTGPVLADIFLGRITRWSDPAIVGLNPGLRLPDAPIAVIHRSDGSGTTFNFTAYLAAVSPGWKLEAGSGPMIAWPTGTAAKGNEGVARAVKATRNAIGYVEYAQATELGLAHALLQNRAGRFVRPDAATFQAAAAGADWSAASDFHLVLTNPAGEQAYPIVATVFALMRKAGSGARTRSALDFFRWSLRNGSGTASALGYVPLPPVLVQQVEAYWGRAFHAGR
jgi:phosphate transport system substrate-binding protein